MRNQSTAHTFRFPLVDGTLVTFTVLESLDEAAAARDVGYLRGVEHLAKGVDRGTTSYEFVTTEFDGSVSVVDARCVRAAEALGDSLQYCARGARVGLYDVDSPANSAADYRANARPD